MKDAQCKRKKPRDTSRADDTELQRSKEVMLLAKPWKAAQLTQLRKLSCVGKCYGQQPRIEATCRDHMQESRTAVAYRGHASCLVWSAFTNGQRF